MNRIKVLLFVDRMRVGGIQTLLVNMYEYFNHEIFQIDFLVLDDGEPYELEDTLRSGGAIVYKLHNIWVRKPIDYKAYIRAVDRFFEAHHNYQVVHIHTGSKNFYILKCAKKYGIPIRVAHSHNSGYQTKSKLQILLGEVLKYPLKKAANYYMACSSVAGEWMFGKKLMKQRKVILLPNGVDLEKFQFSEEERKRKRRELQIEDKIVIGNVGRFTTQKNHLFLLEIFAEIHRVEPKSVLLLAGIGERMEEAKIRAAELGVANVVQFLGFRTDVRELVQAMDVFVMPSLYEGFPVTAVEAQATGLPCVFSDTITREAKLLDQVEYIALNASREEWAEKVLTLVKCANRIECKEKLTAKGFDIRNMVGRLEHLYVQL